MNDGYRGSEELDQPFRPIRLASAVDTVVTSIISRADFQNVCESPIELSLMVALVALAELEFDVLPQVKLARFRYDFGIARVGSEKLLALIECDGRDFHSTPAQLANDQSKNAVARQLNLPLFRFTGSQIFRDRFACAKSVFQFIVDQERRVAGLV